MARADKIRDAASQFVGAPISRGGLVSPPGSLTYRNVTGSADYSRGATGLIGDALAEKAGGNGLGGAAGEFPTEVGFIGTTDTELVYLKTHKLTGKATERLASWPLTEVSITYLPKDKGRPHPGVEVTFGDGTSVKVFGEKKWGVPSFE